MQNKTLIFSALVTALLSVFSIAAQAQAYQWKDSSGRTIISDQPPPKGTPATNVQTTTDPGVSSSAGKAPAKSAADQDLEFRKRRLEAQEKTDKAAKEEADKKANEENCDRAKRYLATLDSGERIGRRNDKGEMEIMGDSFRTSEAEKVRADIAKNCK